MDLVAVHVARPFIWLRHSILSPGGPLHSFSQYVIAVTLCNVKPQKWYFLFFWWLRFDSHCINSNYPCLWLICSIKNSQINYNGSLYFFLSSTRCWCHIGDGKWSRLANDGSQWRFLLLFGFWLQCWFGSLQSSSMQPRGWRPSRPPLSRVSTSTSAALLSSQHARVSTPVSESMNYLLQIQLLSQMKVENQYFPLLKFY